MFSERAQLSVWEAVQEARIHAGFSAGVGAWLWSGAVRMALLTKLLFCRNTLDVCFGCSLMSFRSSAVLTMTLF